MKRQQLGDMGMYARIWARNGTCLGGETVRPYHIQQNTTGDLESTSWKVIKGYPETEADPSASWLFPEIQILSSGTGKRMSRLGKEQS